MTQRIGRYEVVETLGKGGMGVVYRARDPELGRDVAIKVVLSWAQFDDDALARFNREARVVAQLQHPHIVTVFDAGRTDDGLPYFVMEFLQGTDLGEVLGLAGSLNPARAVRYMLQVCDGLSYAHERDIVHRDLKPANLLITPDDNVKIVDFGIAKLVGAQITGTGVSLGTPLYMAPEQVAGKTVDHRADIFALGGVLYAMLTGQSPFEAPTLGGICYKIETQSPRPLSEMGVQVPPQLEKVIRRALEKDPETRYQSASALADDLRRVDAVLDKVATAPTVITPPASPAREERRPHPAARPARGSKRIGALVVIAGIAIAAALWAWPGSPLRRDADSSEMLSADAASAEGFPGSSAAEDGDGGATQPPSSGSGDDSGSGATAGGGANAGDGGTGEPTGDASRTGVADRGVISGDVPPFDEPADEEPPPLYPATNIDRAAVNQLVAQLFRGLENKDSAAIARVFGGTIPTREWRALERLIKGPKLRIRYRIEDVGAAADGFVVAATESTILFIGAPRRVPPPRQANWVFMFQADEMGRLQLRRIRTQ